MVCSHVHGEAARSRNFLQLALSTRRPAQVIQPPDDLEHRGECDLADPISQALVWPITKVYVQVEVAIKLDFVRFGESGRVFGCCYLFG